MTYCEDFIEKLRRELPELCTTKDLIKFGIYKNCSTAFLGRKMGHITEYFRLSRRTIVYPKKAVIEFFENSINQSKGNFSENSDSGRSNTKSKS